VIAKVLRLAYTGRERVRVNGRSYEQGRAEGRSRGGVLAYCKRDIFTTTQSAGWSRVERGLLVGTVPRHHEMRQAMGVGCCKSS
jgi:hypothetical protein